MQVYQVTIRDTSDFDAIVYEAVWSTYEKAEATANQLIADYMETADPIFRNAWKAEIRGFVVRD